MLLLRLFITTFTISCIAVLFVSPSPAETETAKLLLIDTSASCISAECHGQMGRKKFVHTIGVNPNKCKRCHEVIKEGEHRFVPTPVETGVLCALCHDKNVAAPKDVLGNPPKVLPAGNAISVHKPFAEGKCTLCHDAHESDYPKHLKADYPEEPYATYSEGKYQLCFSADCHKDYRNILEEPRLFSGTRFRNGNLNLHYKHVNKKKGRTCITCHLNHSARKPELITESFAFGTRTLRLDYEQTETGGSCTTPCHRTGKYDRYEPAFNTIRTSPTPGRAATKEELDASRAIEMTDTESDKTQHQK
jgi:predicted CXXCH cytochrome family protein